MNQKKKKKVGFQISGAGGVPHQEINASDDEPLSCVLVRSDQEPVVVNLNLDPVEKPEAVHWIGPTHPHPIE